MRGRRRGGPTGSKSEIEPVLCRFYNASSTSDFPIRGLAGHAATLFAITAVGLALSFGLSKFLSGDWPWIMVSTIPAATAVTTFLVGVIYAVRVGVEG